MNKFNEKEILNLAINTELAVSELYSLYLEYFDDDKILWWEILEEENNHAALLKSALEFLDADILPDNFTNINIIELKKFYNKIVSKIELFKANKPDKINAYNFAIEIENEGYENLYQNIMDNSTNDKILKIFQQINNNEKDHYVRIKKAIENVK